MVIHENECVEHQPVGVDVIAQLADEASPVVVVEEDLRPPVSMGGDVVERIGKVDPWQAWHPSSIAETRLSQKCKVKACPVPPDYGFETDFWTTRRLIQVFQSEFGVIVSKQSVMRRLHEAGLTYQKPEREYFELSEEQREEWIRTEVPKIRRAVRKHRAILCFQDEANVSLTALLGKTWAPRSQTPKQQVTGKRAGVAAMSAITKRGRLIFRLHEKRIASAEVIDFLGQMLKHHRRRHLVVVMDQAPPHTSKKTVSFIESQRRLHVFYLPKYPPDWNPDEKVWNHLKHQELKGHQARTKEELKAITDAKLTRMAREPRLLRGIYFRCCISELFD